VVLLPARNLRIRAGNLYGKIVGPLVFKAAGIEPIIENKERVTESAPALFVCNHTSTIDMWVGMWLCPFGGCGVAKKEITRVPFFGQAYQLSGHLLIDRGNRDRALNSMASAREVVKKNNMSLWMWPEGTRSRDGKLLPLKKGFVHLAIATGLPIVPIVFHDADQLWPGRTFRATPGKLQIKVLEPVDTSEWKTETAAEHAEAIWQAFQNELSDRQKADTT
tara:strand:- start:259 stop:921 length:663 start_codon:yes stop_codon:yes gene_type:complete